MAFISSPRFPDSISYKGRCGPWWLTDIVGLRDGAEQRNENWSQAIWKAEVGLVNRSYAETVEILAHFNAVGKGRRNSFRVKDHVDYIGTDELIGSGDGSTTVFQIVKHYTIGGEDFERIITKIVSGTLSISFDAINQPSGWTVDNETGLVTFSSAPADTVDEITATYQFDFPAAYTTDRLPIRPTGPNSYSWESIILLETREI